MTGPKDELAKSVHCCRFSKRIAKHSQRDGCMAQWNCSIWVGPGHLCMGMLRTALRDRRCDTSLFKTFEGTVGAFEEQAKQGG